MLFQWRAGAPRVPCCAHVRACEQSVVDQKAANQCLSIQPRRCQLVGVFATGSLALPLEAPLERLLEVSGAGWVRGRQPPRARGGDCLVNFGVSTLTCCRRRDPAPAPHAVSNRRGMWDGERPKQNVEVPNAIELAGWGRGAGAFEVRATSAAR